MPIEKLDKLNDLLRRAEEHLRSLKLTEAKVEIGSYHLGMVKLAEWRLAVARDGEQWISIHECTIPLRILAAQGLPELEKAIVRANNELLIRAERAIEEVEMFLAGVGKESSNGSN